MDVALQRGGVIAGRVVDEAGDPLVEVRVMATQRPAACPGAGVMPADLLLSVGPGDQTNDLGEFRLYSLAGGEYYVQAMPRPDFGGALAPRATTILPTFPQRRTCVLRS